MSLSFPLLCFGTNRKVCIEVFIIHFQYVPPCFLSYQGGARVVRIAVHPTLQGMGYGSRSVELLYRYYNGDLLHTCQQAIAPIRKRSITLRSVVEQDERSKLLSQHSKDASTTVAVQHDSFQSVETM